MTNPRITAMRGEGGAINERRRLGAGLSARDAQRSRILEAALRAYQTDAQLEAAEAAAKNFR